MRAGILFSVYGLSLPFVSVMRILHPRRRQVARGSGSLSDEDKEEERGIGQEDTGNKVHWGACAYNMLRDGRRKGQPFPLL